MRRRPGANPSGALAPSVYLPTLVYGIGQGAVAPAVVLAAGGLGASPWQAGAMVGVAGFGLVLGDVPAGALVDRLGERAAVLVATGVAVASLALCLVAGSVGVLAVGVLGTGVSSAVWGVARQVYVTDAVPYEMRARALSTLAGARRAGVFVGPFAGAAAIGLLSVDGAFWVHVGTAVAAAALLVGIGPAPAPAHHAGRQGTLRVLRSQAPVLRTLGVAVVVLGAVRASRQAVIPLWGAHLGVDPVTTSVVFGLSAAADMLLFYPAGSVMDRVGRRWVAVPALLVMALGHAALPLATTVAAFAAVAVLLGVGNGMSSGIVMTLGADVSPREGRAQFLGAWRLCNDVGGGVGPLVLAGVVALTSLGPAVMVMGGVALVGAALMRRWVPAAPGTTGTPGGDHVPVSR